MTRLNCAIFVSGRVLPTLAAADETFLKVLVQVLDLKNNDAGLVNNNNNNKNPSALAAALISDDPEFRLEHRYQRNNMNVPHRRHGDATQQLDCFISSEYF